MKSIFNILFSAICICAQAQETKKIELINADETLMDTKKHPEYWRLLGNVSFKHNNATMECDSAHHYSLDNKIEAFGKVAIRKEKKLTLKANHLIYEGKDNLALLKGQVILKDSFNTLTTEIIKFDLENDIAYYENKGTIKDRKQTIISKKGKYLTKLDKYYFNDSVQVIAKGYNILSDQMNYDTKKKVNYFHGPSYFYSEDKTIYCEKGWYNSEKGLAEFIKNVYLIHNNHLLKADTLQYNKEKLYAVAHNNVQLIDTSENLIVSGGIAEYYEDQDRVIITENPILKMFFKKDTLFMHAEKFVSNQKEKRKTVSAYKKVKFYKRELSGKCDSLNYKFSDSLIEMFHKPIIWVEEFQITADSIQFLVYNNEVKKMYLSSKPIIINKEDSIDFNQIKGKRMVGQFNGNELYKMDISGNGQSIFLVKDDSEKKVGINNTYCTDLTLYFKENKLENINYQKKPNSKTIPYNEITEEERYLRGFIWREKERPRSKLDILIEQ